MNPLPDKNELLRKALSYLQLAEGAFDADGDPCDVTNFLHFASTYLALAEHAEEKPSVRSTE